MDSRKKSIGILGAFALSVGTSIGWGSFVVTGSNYLSKAGLLGSIIGIALGALLMFIIAYNYHFMINQTPDSGGIYSFVKHTLNGDHAFLASWFLIIVYTGILWANVTSVALFSRYLFGGIFQFGRLYSISGYDVYIGEVLLCAGVLILIGGLTFFNKRITTSVTFGLVLIFVAAIVFVSVFTLVKQNDIDWASMSFVSEEGRFGQIVAVLAMTPWAFIGFESISHSAGSFSFKTKKTLKILLASLTVSAVIYILLCQISVMAHPEMYASWLDYIANNAEEGIMGIPPFFVARYYLGNAGVVIFGVALFAIIATSIIGNIYAISNLIQRMAEDDVFPRAFVPVNKNDIPVRVRFFVIGITALAIFLGRSAIGYIVDVNNIGGVIVYAYVSVCAFIMGSRKNSLPAKIFGALGFIASLVFGISHLIPVFSTAGSIARETFIVFVIFSLVGFAFFAFLIKKDTKGNFGSSSVVWVGFSIMIAFFSGAWIIQRSKLIHGELMSQIKEHYALIGANAPDEGFLEQIEGRADKLNIAGMITLFVIVSLTFIILFAILYLIKEKEKRHKKQLEKISDMANKDPLTGVNNHRAYIANEKRLTSVAASDPGYKYGLVVCDVNDLKYVNDRFGHDYGDEYICKACRILSSIFSESTVFRTGGDEFVVILEGEDYMSRKALLSQLNEASLKNAATDDGIVIAAGMAEKNNNEEFDDVFRRADKNMYVNKSLLKEKRPSHNLR
ncbi:MAG: amino acid permease [Clostridia bacterium]|nr:amino acid permease [Clostridia bacterium]